MTKRKPNEEQLRQRHDEATIRLRAAAAGLAKVIGDNETGPSDMEVIDILYVGWQERLKEYCAASKIFYSFTGRRRRRRTFQVKPKKKKAQT